MDYDQIREITEKYLKDKVQAITQNDRLKMATIRMPSALYNCLSDKAYDNRISLNKFCIASLLEAINPNKQLDLIKPQLVEIQIRDDGKVIWVNANGICVLRICQIGELLLLDNRRI